jgi:hypothetical protein
MSLFLSEIRKITGWRATWGIFQVMVVLVVAQQLVIIFLEKGRPQANSFFTMPGLSTSMIAMMFGAFVLATEHTRGSATTLYVATPKRLKVLIVKSLAAITLLVPVVAGLVGIGVLAAFVDGARNTATVTTFGVHHVVLQNFTSAEVLRSLAGVEASCCLGVLLGVGVAALIRNTTTCLGVIAGFFIVIDNLLGLWSGWGAFSLNSAVQRLNAGGARNAAQPDFPRGLLVLAIWAAAVCLVGWFLECRRDISASPS